MKANVIGRYTALLSFVIGSIIFLSYYITSEVDFLFVGYIYVIVAFLINLAVLGRLIYLSFSPAKTQGINKTIWLMFGNFPIAIVYLYIVMVLLNTMRITIVNGTGNEISDIEIIGCGGGVVGHLGIGEAEVVWVEIVGDCEISVSFKSNGHREEEVIMDYVTSSIGQKLSYVIENKDLEASNIELSEAEGLGQSEDVDLLLDTANLKFDNRSKFTLSEVRKSYWNSSDTDTASCDNWFLKEDQVYKIISGMKLINGSDWHYLYGHFLCAYEGVITQNDIEYTFSLNSGSWMILYNDDGQWYYGDIDGSFEDWFQDGVWKEEDWQ